MPGILNVLSGVQNNPDDSIVYGNIPAERQHNTALNTLWALCA